MCQNFSGRLWGYWLCSDLVTNSIYVCKCIPNLAKIVGFWSWLVKDNKSKREKRKTNTFTNKTLNQKKTLNPNWISSPIKTESFESLSLLFSFEHHYWQISTSNQHKNTPPSLSVVVFFFFSRRLSRDFVWPRRRRREKRGKEGSGGAFFFCEEERERERRRDHTSSRIQKKRERERDSKRELNCPYYS